MVFDKINFIVIFKRYLLSCGDLNWVSLFYLTRPLYLTHNLISFFDYHIEIICEQGIGAGMIKTSFFILISTLFVVKRQTAHSMVHLGSFTGMLLIPPFTEYVILTLDWKSALYFHLSKYTYRKLYEHF